jgi:hypothetical protein
LAALAWAFLFELDLPVATKLNPWMKNQRNVIKRRSTHLYSAHLSHAAHSSIHSDLLMTQQKLSKSLDHCCFILDCKYRVTHWINDVNWWNSKLFHQVSIQKLFNISFPFVLHLFSKMYVYPRIVTSLNH